MMQSFLKFSILLVFLTVFLGCQEKDPSIAKIFVRNNNNILIQDMEVLLVANDSNTPEFNATARTSQAGYATFRLDEVFDQFTKQEKRDRLGYFKIYLQIEGEGIVKMGEISARPHITAVKTIYLPN